MVKKKFCNVLTSPPRASNLKLSIQETLASDTVRPSSSKAPNIGTSNPGQVLSECMFTRNPFSRVSTATCIRKCMNIYVHWSNIIEKHNSLDEHYIPQAMSSGCDSSFARWQYLDSVYPLSVSALLYTLTRRQ